MSELADRERLRKQGWAAPGGFHDFVVGSLKMALPAMIGVLLAYLALAPLSKSREISFILDKSKVAVARERMRVQAARYSGQDEKGRPFVLEARSAVQATSRDPIVDIVGMAARIALDDGPATLGADQGRYNLDSQQVAVAGPVVFNGAGGYRMETRDVTVDLNKQTLASGARVEGDIPLGHFSGDRLAADLPTRDVTLTGNARLHIVQRRIR